MSEDSAEIMVLAVDIWSVYLAPTIKFRLRWLPQRTITMAPRTVGRTEKRWMQISFLSSWAFENSAIS